MKLPLIILSCLLLSACTSNPPVTWYHTVRSDKLQEDVAECKSLVGSSMFAQVDCLKKKGWKPVSGTEQKRCHDLTGSYIDRLSKLRSNFQKENNNLLKSSDLEKDPVTTELIDALITVEKERMKIMEGLTKEADFCFSPKATQEANEFFDKRKSFIGRLEANKQKLASSGVTFNRLIEALRSDEDITSLLNKK